MPQFLFVFGTFLSSGGWVEIRLKAPTVPRIRYMPVCQYSPTLPLRQQLVLLLPGA